MAKTLEQFYQTIREEILLLEEQDTSGWEYEDFLTSIFLDYLEEAGEVISPMICPFRDRGLQLNAYAFAEDYSSLDIFVSIYSDNEQPRSVSQADLDAAIKRAIQLYRRAINDLYTVFERDNDTYEFAITVFQQKEALQNVRIFALTNGLVKPINFSPITLENTEISFGIWDMDRLYRCATSGKMRETIEIDFEEKYGLTIPCIEDTPSDKYSVYLAIISGSLLAELYREYRDRLLEKNVRSFLQVKGGVNKGIRNTLREEPEMFLAYNNGISVTAESIGIVRDANGRPSIKSIRDMQIVNGGQTTASIFNASTDKKAPADVSKVSVQMKISVITDPADMDEIVPRISLYANSQNKVQVADFSANDPFHRRLEELSRTIWSPAPNGGKPVNWFYERARGQYADMLSLESTPTKRRVFKETHPLFTKTDMAKYEMTWDQMPFSVSKGAQKNFYQFNQAVTERKILPDEKYFHNLVAKAILFRSAEKIVQAQKYGGYRANIVTYTLAWLSHRTAQRIDLDRIWKEQALTPALQQEIAEVSRFVHDRIVNPPGGANVGEWCKKEKCWEVIREVDHEISEALKAELISVERPGTTRVTPRSSILSDTAEEKKVIEEVAGIPAVVWFALSRWAKETNNLASWQRGIVFSVGTIVGRGNKPSFKQANQAMKAYNEATKRGFDPESVQNQT